MGEDEPLVTTSVAAKRLGIAARTLQHWTRQGVVTPTRTLPSGHARWRISDLDEQVRMLVDRRTAEGSDRGPR